MNCIKVNVKSLSISNRKDNKQDDIVLYYGDYFFIDKQKYFILNTFNKYSEVSILKHILYNKMIPLKKGIDVDYNNYEWTWIRDINIISPVIKTFTLTNYGKGSISHGRIAGLNQLLDLNIIVDDTITWNRENNNNSILSKI